MKILLITFVLLLPLVAFSQENLKNESVDSLAKEVKTLQKRIVDLEKTKNRIRISGKEKTLKAYPKIKFDFSEPDSITIPNKIKEGDFYQIEVTGINLNQYLIVMENSDTIYSTPLSFPTFGTLDLSSLNDLVKSLSPNLSKAAQQVLADSKTDKSLNGNKSFDKNSSYVNEDITRFFNELALKMEQQKKRNDLDSLITSRIEKETVQVSLYLDQLSDINYVIDDKKYDYMAYRILRQTNDTSDDYKPVIRADLKEYDKLRDSLKSLMSAFDVDLKSLTAFINSDNVKDFLAKNNKVSLKDKLIKIEKALTEGSEKTAKALELVSPGNIENQLTSVVNLYQRNTYTSLPIQYHKEQAEVKIKFVPKDSVSRLQPYYLSPIKFPHQRFYWSVGPSLYYAKLENQRVGTQTIQVNDSTQRYQLLKENTLEREMGAAVLLRGGAKLWRPSGWVPSLGVHLAVGTGLSLGEEIRPRMLLGGGITVGQKHSLAIDLGWIGGTVNVVSNNVDYIQFYNEKPEILVKEFQSEFFWSVGYAFRL